MPEEGGGGMVKADEREIQRFTLLVALALGTQTRDT
jgi:hypothetical protein